MPIVEEVKLTGELALNYTSEVFVPMTYERTKDMIFAPTLFREMIWIVIPLIVTLVVMEFYFGRYKSEELGWNSAMGNSLVLIFVSIDLLRRLYGDDFFNVFLADQTWNRSIHTLIALAILFEGFIIMFFDFFHILPKKFAFIFSSSLPINLTAYVAIVIIYSNLSIDLFTLSASITLLIGLIIIFAIVHLIEPKVRDQYMEEFEGLLSRYRSDNNEES